MQGWCLQPPLCVSVQSPIPHTTTTAHVWPSLSKIRIVGVLCRFLWLRSDWPPF